MASCWRTTCSVVTASTTRSLPVLVRRLRMDCGASDVLRLGEPEASSAVVLGFMPSMGVLSVLAPEGEKGDLLGGVVAAKDEDLEVPSPPPAPNLNLVFVLLSPSALVASGDVTLLDGLEPLGVCGSFGV